MTNEELDTLLEGLDHWSPEAVERLRLHVTGLERDLAAADERARAKPKNVDRDARLVCDWAAEFFETQDDPRRTDTCHASEAPCIGRVKALEVRDALRRLGYGVSLVTIGGRKA